MTMGQMISGAASRGNSCLAVHGDSALLSEAYRRTVAQNFPSDLDLCQDFIRPSRLDTVLSLPPLPKEIQEAHSWNPDDRSFNIFIKEEDKLTFHRHPVAQSTDGIRSKIGYTRGFHVFEMTWPMRQRGTHAVVGVATKVAPLHSMGYCSLVGLTADSWGWDIGRNKLYHNAKKCHSSVTYPASLVTGQNFVVPDTFLMILDMDEGTLCFGTRTEFLGTAFHGLKGKKLYPVISAVWGHCEITMCYLGGLDRKYIQLFALLLIFIEVLR
ncbi:unnamed protein product [Soboliphyme baturini]|uniref:B30.2/SPRY domain-containing protein n=1 Tax=Soboliphyme baturini TaxID=241478 RepID=A0A183J0X7_9BILA|nr:unnamed protein product [Soboliphyme baturini]